jgi:hypothetical protein
MAKPFQNEILLGVKWKSWQGLSPVPSNNTWDTSIRFKINSQVISPISSQFELARDTPCLHQGSGSWSWLRVPTSGSPHGSVEEGEGGSGPACRGCYGGSPHNYQPQTATNLPKLQPPLSPWTKDLTKSETKRTRPQKKFSSPSLYLLLDPKGSV